MAVLSKQTVQGLAVLRSLSLWRKGAYGPVRLHKTLFFADQKGNEDWRLFTFKRYYLGQYSDEIAASLNALNDAKRISTVFDGPSERIRVAIRPNAQRLIGEFFASYFPEWTQSLAVAFKDWAYLSNDDILAKAHQDDSYTKSQHGDVIFTSFPHEAIEFSGLDTSVAERLADLVDVRLQQGLRKKLAESARRKVKGEDWRAIYFGEPSAA